MNPFPLLPWVDVGFLCCGRHLVVVWDAWFCEGSKVIFRYGLALLKMYKKRLKALSKLAKTRVAWLDC